VSKQFSFLSQPPFQFILFNDNKNYKIQYIFLLSQCHLTVALFPMHQEIGHETRKTEM